MLSVFNCIDFADFYKGDSSLCWPIVLNLSKDISFAGNEADSC